jgi:hypothetical protein
MAYQLHGWTDLDSDSPKAWVLSTWHKETLRDVIAIRIISGCGRTSMSLLDTSNDFPNVHFFIPSEITIQLSMTVLVGRDSSLGYLVDESGDYESVAIRHGFRSD